jgi:hypothetical protein
MSASWLSLATGHTAGLSGLTPKAACRRWLESWHRVVASGPIAELRDDSLMRDLYLGDAKKIRAT